MGRDGNATAEDGARWLAEMNAKMKVPGLSHWWALKVFPPFLVAEDAELKLQTLLLCFGRGVSKADAAPSSELVDKSQISSSMQGNPIKLTDEEAGRLVELSLPAASETTKL